MANIPNKEDLVSLTNVITRELNKYVGMVKEHDLATAESCLLSGESLQDQADIVIKASSQLQAMISEPSHWVLYSAWSYLDSVAISLVLEMNLHKIIGHGEKATSLDYLATCSGASPLLIKRVMRQCTNRSIFTETDPGYYKHNQHSLRLDDQDFGSLIHYLTDDGLLCGAYLSRTMSENKFEVVQDSRQAAFCKAFQTTVPLYNYYHNIDTNRGQRFSRAMAGHYDGPLDKPLESIFPFQDVPTGSLVVDIGGGNGQHTIRLASRYPHISFVVQDHSNVVHTAEKVVELSEDVARRIRWQAHDFYAPQPQKGAAVYLMSHILMDNTDEKCIQMIRVTAEAMDPQNSRLLVHDFVDSCGVNNSQLLNMLDLHMIASLNTASRSEAEWDMLIEKADDRLERCKTWAGKDGSAVLEIRFRTT